MRRGLKLDRQVLRSRVARRMFLVFAICSLLPIVTFGLYAYLEVRAQLELDAGAALRRESKAAGMAIVERLLIAEQHLRSLSEQRDSERAKIAASGRGGIVAVATRALSAEPGMLTQEQQAHLLGGGVVLVEERDARSTPRLHLIVARARGATDATLFVAELDPIALFGPERREEGDRYWVASADGRVLFADPWDSLGAALPNSGDGSDQGSTFAFDVASARQIGAAWPLFLRARFLSPGWTVAVSRRASEIYRPVEEFERVFPLMAVATLVLALVASLSQIRLSLGPIEALADAARRLSRGELDARVTIATRDEFSELGRTFNDMAHEIGQQIHVLNEVNEIGVALSAEVDTERLLDLILRGAMRVNHARGGAIFLVEEDGTLHRSRIQLLGEGSRPNAEFAEDALLAALAQRCYERGDRVDVRFDTSPQTSATQTDATHPALALGECLAVPMRNGRDEILGALLLFREAGTALPPFSGANAHLSESLASQAAIAITKNRIVSEFRILFEGVIQLTARAIDEKSPYTGDHCRRVPILTELIADSACAASRGALKDFTLTPEERYELRVAALLHDCGKVVTPVHVMDKATKLEAIFDRIGLVEMRFEILRRDLKVASHPGNEAALAPRLRELEADLAFLRQCNVGSEGMPEADRERVRAIARRHAFTAMDGSSHAVLTPDEIENLTIARGTLNDAEREVIKQHVVTTINLLSELPFPRALRNVPAIAGSHHEQVDGSGYPNGLHREQISMQGRILGLADVFEALTAKDRPYKDGRTLSETLEILASMRDAGHIDPDLYELFVEEKVYLRYAAGHLSPEQIDPAHWEDLERFTARHA
jgi:HD-GYP domain-containing protein (c-di-GMP phosphodiesterase class II)/HAMP domain-containing protein